MADYRYLLLLLLLLCFISGRKSRLTQSKTPGSSIHFLPRSSCRFGNESSLYLSKNSSSDGGPSDNYTLANLVVQTSVTDTNIPISSQSSGPLNNLLQLTTSASGAAPTTLSSPRSCSFSRLPETSVQTKPGILGSILTELSPSSTSGKFEHISVPLWPLVNSSRNLADRTSNGLSAHSCTNLVTGSANLSDTAPINPSSKGSQMNTLSASLSRPATVSGRRS